MKASEKSARFIQFVNMASNTDRSLVEFMEYIACNHGDVFDFVIENFDICMVWWMNAKHGGEIL